MHNSKDSTGNLRVTSGIAKNKHLVTPTFPEYKAVKEVVKLAIFSIIGENINGASVLDLFAGSGNMGIEALSRGAVSAIFVDENYESIGVINKNIENTGFLDYSTVVKKSCVKFIEDTDKKFDIVFIDPFYKDHSQKHLFSLIKRTLNENATIFYTHENTLDIMQLITNTSLNLVEQRKYGATTLSIISN